MPKFKLQHVYRIGSGHTKWLVVLDEAEGNVERDLERIQKVLFSRFGYNAIKDFNHVEYLGRG